MRTDWRYIFEIIIILLASFYNWNQGYKKGIDVGLTISSTITAKYIYDTDSKEKFENWVNWVERKKNGNFK